MLPAANLETIDLLAGDSLAAWKGWRRNDMPKAWTLSNGILKFTPGGDGGDICTRQEFRNFILELEWNVGKAGNSGIFYRAHERDGVPYLGALEMQVLDDAGHQDGGNTLTSAGSAYGMYAPSQKVSKPAGEWNKVKIVCKNLHIEHWLNDVKICDFWIGSKDWADRYRNSKFAGWANFGKNPVGKIALQDHGDPVMFRNIRVTPL